MLGSLRLVGFERSANEGGLFGRLEFADILNKSDGATVYNVPVVFLAWTELAVKTWGMLVVQEEADGS